MTKKPPVEFDPIRKQLFVESLTLGVGPVEAVKAAGFEARQYKPLAEKLMQDEDVQAMLGEYAESLKAKYDVSRDAVLKHLIDAMEIAKIQGDAKAMVAALKEISDVMGHHAPKQVAVEQTHRVDKNVRGRLRQITDEELVELAEEAEFKLLDLTPTVVEGEVVDG